MELLDGGTIDARNLDVELHPRIGAHVEFIRGVAGIGPSPQEYRIIIPRTRRIGGGLRVLDPSLDMGIDRKLGKAGGFKDEPRDTGGLDRTTGDGTGGALKGQGLVDHGD